MPAPYSNSGKSRLPAQIRVGKGPCPKPRTVTTVRLVLVIFCSISSINFSVIGCGRAESPSHRNSEEVTIFAAASLREALEQLGEDAEELGLRPVFNFAGSNVLARQIEATAGADLLLSANREWVEHLRRQERLVESTLSPFLSNQLVVIGHPASSLRLERLEELGTLPFAYLSLADPRAVPAGIYARKFLQSVALPGGDLWQLVAPRVAPAPDVRAAMALVEARSDVVGIVYNSDARSSQKVEVLYQVPLEATPEITYWAAQVVDGKSPQAAARFLTLLHSPKAAQIFAQYGFEPLKNIDEGITQP